MSLRGRAPIIASTLKVADLAARAWAVTMALGVGSRVVERLWSGQKPYDPSYLLVGLWLICIVVSAWPRKAREKGEE